MKKLLSIVYLLALAGSVSAQIGPESAFTRTLKTNTTATAWANALTNGLYTPLVDHFYPKSAGLNYATAPANILTISNAITAHNVEQLAGLYIVGTNFGFGPRTNWFQPAAIGLVVAGTDGEMALVGNDGEGGHPNVLDFVSIDPVTGNIVTKTSLSQLSSANGGGLEAVTGTSSDLSVNAATGAGYVRLANNSIPLTVVQNSAAFGVRFSRTGYDTYELRLGNSGALNFYNVTDARVDGFIDGSGNWGLGNVAPTVKLDVTGTVKATGFSGPATLLTALPAAQLSGVVPAANGGAGATTGILKADGAGLVSAAVAGTDYLSPASNLDATKLVNEVPFAALPTGAGATDVAPGDHDHTSLLNIDAIRAKAISSPVIILGTVASTSTTLTKNRAHTVTVNSLTNLFNFPADPTTNDWVELIINSTSSSSQLHFAIGGTTNYMVWEGRGYTSFSMTNVTGTAGISRFGAVYDGTIWRPEAIGDAFAPSAAVAWGAITGTLSGQTDLQSALDAKESSTSNNIDPDRLNGDSVDDNLIDDGLLPSTFTRDTEIAEAKKGQIFLTLDGNGSAISTGQKGYVRVPWSGTITGWEIVADTSGNIVVDVWKDTYANFPPTDADSIAGSELPTLSGVQKNTDTSLTWTGSGAVTAGDWIGWNVDSASTVTRVHIALFGTKN